MRVRPQTRTKVGLLVLGLAALGLELAAAIWGGHSLISEVAWATTHPGIWTAFGVLLGHIVWQSAMVYRWARGEIDLIRRGALERYHVQRARGVSPADAEGHLMFGGDLDRYSYRGPLLDSNRRHDSTLDGVRRR